MNRREDKRNRGSGTCAEASIYKELSEEQNTVLPGWQRKMIGVLTAWSAMAAIREGHVIFLFLLAVLLYSSWTDFREQSVYNLPVALLWGMSFFCLLAGRVWENKALPVFLVMTGIVLLMGFLKVWGLGDSNLIIGIGLWELMNTREPLVFLIRMVVTLLIGSLGFILAFLFTKKKRGPFVPYLTAGFLLETVFCLYSM